MRSLIIIFCAFCGVLDGLRTPIILKVQRSCSRGLTLSASTSSSEPGGKIVVTGLDGDKDEDEFTLNLLNEQEIWSTVLFGTTDVNVNAAQKQLISRKNKYSGLSDILKFQSVAREDELREALQGANTWLAFNVAPSYVATAANIAIEAKIPRIIMTTAIKEEDDNSNYIQSTFEPLLTRSKENGLAMTLIRHGKIIDGDEDYPYQIVRDSTPLVEMTVPRGVLGRVATELIRLDESNNHHCGLSTSGEFAEAYLELLRSTGLSRRQEVYKVFTGGMDTIYKKTEERRRKREQEEAEQEAKMEERRQMREEEERRDKLRRAEIASAAAREGGGAVPNLPSTSSPSFRSTAPLQTMEKQQGFLDPDEEEEDEDGMMRVQRGIKSLEERIEERANYILEEIYHVYNTRMVTKRTGRDEFYRMNNAKAIELARKEIEEEDEKAIEKEIQRKVDLSAMDSVFDIESRQYAKLMQLERREMQQQKEASDIWVKYIYLLLEVTMDDCAKKDILFHNLDEFQQTLILRERANELRAKVNLPPFEVVYDSLDAKLIVDHFVNNPKDSLTKKYQLLRTADEILVDLNGKYGKMLKSVTALRSATQIIELAIETLRKELPPPPPKPQDIRLQESKRAQKKMNELRLEKIRNRLTPFAGKEEAVGRL